MSANTLKDMVDMSEVTIGEALWLKLILDLTDSEAIAVFLGGTNCENVQV